MIIVVVGGWCVCFCVYVFGVQLFWLVVASSAFGFYLVVFCFCYDGILYWCVF